ncbi:MAG: hypothetical protein A3F53_01070 [Candidatus Zambryskibacteria bacterium RIFCSPHIGHO2_12_FULL_48_10]|uniref:DUF5667 domain-containing protein n=1 Tax=Candidatus Zambryskibacteria bacterium RIFCSPHIGHO2_01_FULL_46_25 TaxID=1802738 RepID=A0A1G2SZB1_9BACT|nr:MAG: hypothetical protein UX71_C0002G0207 [Parcubacteria group bacterium GW2011_GWA1_47_10]OHA90078.1 MAG: hypothetical protein A2838_00365 [Candidatus Zambryskibacteria bacterium RIFCSPHIGHO2_01_FULL_46_25]OHB00870.1 MAG: hypothetical protein A3F53_01070 [Candidatus Zambryskibacteria bacterium RIFCSPHIGHO2_12_FULL_48_10]OHB06547.1 MAG: hypothetical protein A3A31_02890 [Candidatus Zambryskibacteria bacterium RIFCSPLOWO2_01_FULL_48_25]
MKQKILAITVLATLLLAAIPVSAQSVQRAQQRNASSTEKRMELQSNIAKKRAVNTSRVLTATVERLGNIATRIESRIAKVKAAGGDVTQSEAAIAEARNHLSLAKTSISAFTSIDLSTGDVREKYDRVKAVAAEVKTHLREAHRSLMKAVVSLKK